jgi:hypothetical protein
VGRTRRPDRRRHRVRPDLPSRRACSRPGHPGNKKNTSCYLASFHPRIVTRFVPAKKNHLNQTRGGVVLFFSSAAHTGRRLFHNIDSGCRRSIPFYTHRGRYCTPTGFLHPRAQRGWHATTPHVSPLIVLQTPTQLNAACLTR